MNILEKVPKDIQINILSYIKDIKLRNGKYVEQIPRNIKYNLSKKLNLIKINNICSFVKLNNYKIIVSILNSNIHWVMNKKYYVNDEYDYTLTIEFYIFG
jgi:hypothetical protein